MLLAVCPCRWRLAAFLALFTCSQIAAIGNIKLEFQNWLKRGSLVCDSSYVAVYGVSFGLARECLERVSAHYSSLAGEGCLWATDLCAEARGWRMGAVGTINIGPWWRNRSTEGAGEARGWASRWRVGGWLGDLAHFLLFPRIIHKQIKFKSETFYFQN
jgi:hypothetical protein